MRATASCVVVLLLCYSIGKGLTNCDKCTGKVSIYTVRSKLMYDHVILSILVYRVVKKIAVIQVKVCGLVNCHLNRYCNIQMKISRAHR